MEVFHLYVQSMLRNYVFNGILCLIPFKSHRMLLDVFARPVISNCGALTQKSIRIFKTASQIYNAEQRVLYERFRQLSLKN